MPAVRAAGRSALALGVFAAAAFLLTWPVAWGDDGGIAGDGADANIFLWNAWWLGSALSAWENPYATDAIFWPGGTSLVLHTFSPVNAAAVALLSLAMPATLAFDVVLVAAFALSAWGAYLLARELTGSEAGAYVAGFAFGYAPWRYAHALGHLNLVATHWLPLFLLFLVRYQRSGARRDLALAATMLVGAALTDYALLLLAGLLAVVWTLAGEGWRGAPLRRTVATGLVAALAVSPLAVLLVSAYLEAPDLRDFRVEASRYSLDLFSYVWPSPVSWMYADVGDVLPPGGTPTEATAFLGYALLATAVVGALVAWREARPWVVVAGLFAILSLGPRLVVAGRETGWWMPYAALQRVPLLDTLRTPGRFAVVVALATAILAALAVARLAPRFAPTPRRAAVAMLAALVLAESVVVPFPVTEVALTPLYSEAAARAPAALVELPLHQPGYAGQLGRVSYLAAQTEHGLPLVNGYHARETSRDGQFLRGELVLSAFTRLELGGVAPESLDIFPEQETRGNASALLAARGLHTLLFHVSEPPTETEAREWAFLQTLPGFRVVSSEPRARLVAAEPAGRPPLLLDLGIGWHGLELFDGVPSRWAFQRAELVVHAESPVVANVTLRLSPFLLATQETRTVALVVNGEEVHRADYARGWHDVAARAELREGTNVVELRSVERAVSLSWYEEDGDSRPLAMAVQDVRVRPS